MRPALVPLGIPTLAELIREHWEKPTGELVTIIARHHPAATSAEIIAELRRQGDAVGGSRRLPFDPRGAHVSAPSPVPRRPNVHRCRPSGSRS
jgi:hypothetical protein